ncbi:homoserine kinase [Methylovulum psychrotolerans]|uniref:Homoserine kinase n=1 Tax=Methylovulum psychrotolerans TaxID=1704499 RepID=A0A1Z4BZF4_9GAMM|nr:homoserine kinase [Methylovulum psychrotolerans]ASF46629.1 homoserine kinase [Methylovulum psychrotolerans]
MSVYSVVSPAQINAFFSHYPLGRVLGFSGITDGIDNTNYWVSTSEGEFVLTVFESISASDLPHFMDLLGHLAAQGLPCPYPLPDRQAQHLRLLNHKHAAVFRRCPGRAVLKPGMTHCRQIGWHLARLHQHTQDYGFPIARNHDLPGYLHLFAKIAGQLAAADLAVIHEELAFQAANSHAGLPTGLIHADPFRDNVLFVGDKLSGLLDFYSAGKGVLLLDLAIAAADWCHDDGIVNGAKLAALLAGYETLRPLHTLERRLWPTLLRAAALRFWLSRLVHQLHPRSGAITQNKDPGVFRQLLCQYRQAHRYS